MSQVDMTGRTPACTVYTETSPGWPARKPNGTITFRLRFMFALVSKNPGVSVTFSVMPAIASLKAAITVALKAQGTTVCRKL